MSFTPTQIKTMLKKMLAHADLAGECDVDKCTEYEELTKELGDIVVAEITKHNDRVEEAKKRVSEKLKAKTTTKPIGRAWLPKGTHSDITTLFKCQCVRDGKVVLVEAEHPDDLLVEDDHRNGEWCPCSGMDRKWIYLNEPSTSDPECCGKQLCSSEHETMDVVEECFGCQDGLGDFHVAHLDSKTMKRKPNCKIVEDEDERPLELPPLKVEPKECHGCQLKCESGDGRHYEPTYEECGWERRKGCEFLEEDQTMDVSDEDYIMTATRTPQIDVDGYVEEYFPKTVEEYNKYIGELEDQHWWVWWKNGCK